SSCIRARYSSSRASRASLSAPAGNTRTWLRSRMRSVPATRRGTRAGRARERAGEALGLRGDGSLEARAPLDVWAARLERGLRELVGELLLGGRPVGAERIKTCASQHESVRGRGSAVSEFPRSVSRLANRGAIALMRRRKRRPADGRGTLREVQSRELEPVEQRGEQ